MCITAKKLSTKKHEGKTMRKSDKGKECYQIVCPVYVSLLPLRVPSCTSWTVNPDQHFIVYGGKTL